MAITTGTINSATPATDLYNALATLLTAKSWTHIGQKSAATCGTSAPIDFWCTPDTTVASNVYTGCIVGLEADNTNNRFRMRVMEVFDNGATGSPASNAKWFPPNDAPGASRTPTAGYHTSDSFATITETLGSVSTSTVDHPAFTQLPTATSVSFNYWMGVDSTRCFVAVDQGGHPNWQMAGYIEYLGSSGGTGAVFLAARANTQGSNITWGISNGQQADVKCSREPLKTSSLAGAFTFGIEGSVPGKANQASGEESGNPMGTITGNHQWHTVLVASPAFIHGMFYNGTGQYMQPASKRSHLAKLTNFISFRDEGTEPTIGDTLTISGTQYTILGRAGNVGNTSNAWYCIAVETNAF